jgi:RHS repeat-associated protein
MKRLFTVVLFVSFAASALAVYNPQTGRWLSRDPIGEGGARVLLRGSQGSASLAELGNLYAFVVNTPLNGVDKLGLKAELPTALPDRCQTPCEDAKRKGLDTGDNGGVICCAGTMYVCNWKPSTGNSTADAIAADCITEHENTHLDDVRCPKVWCYAWPTRPDWKKGKDPKTEECSAYYGHLDCLRSSFSRCQGDPVCEDHVQDELDRIARQLNRWGCSR